MEAQDSLVRTLEDLDAIRVVKDELVNALSEKLNRNLYLDSTCAGSVSGLEVGRLL